MPPRIAGAARRHGARRGPRARRGAPRAQRGARRARGPGAPRPRAGAREVTARTR